VIKPGLETGFQVFFPHQPASIVSFVHPPYLSSLSLFALYPAYALDMYSKIAAIAALVATARAQQACTLTTETHPSLTWSECASDGTCTNVDGEVTVDANWR
jgi:hypothetical protein